MPDLPAAVPPQAALFARTVSRMRNLLASASDERSVYAALRWAGAELDRTYAETPAPVRATVACRAGCDFCCRGPIGVQAHEVLLAVDHIRTHFSPEGVAEVIARAAAHRTLLAGPGTEGDGRFMQPCALLRDGRCSIYASRPEICRSHHTSDAQLCAARAADPRVLVDPAYIPALRARMFAVMLGIDEAMEEAGFDDQAYDFGSALHEALTNSLCAYQWAKRKSAFPASCREDHFDHLGEGLADKP
jgi:Fe-S-cluster containining protein